jgi:hypothetical protein
MDQVIRKLWGMLPREAREQGIRELDDGDAELVLELLGK